MAEKSVFGSSSRLDPLAAASSASGVGTNHIEKTIDSADKVVAKFSTALAKYTSVLNALMQSQGGAHLPGATQQSAANLRNGGQPAPAPTPTPNGGYTPGAHSASMSTLDQPTQGYTSVPSHVTPPASSNGGGATFSPSTPAGAAGGGNSNVPPTSHRASSNGGNWAGKVVGAAVAGAAVYAAGHASNQYLEQSVSSQFSYGDNWGPAADAMFKNNVTAVSTADAAQSAQTLSTTSGFVAGTPGYAAATANVGTGSYLDPSISNAQGATAAASLRNPSTYNKLNVLGIHSVNSQGQVDFIALAKQILAKVPWYTEIKTKEQIAAELDDPAGGIAVTINSMVANGFIPTSAVKEVIAAIRGILDAQIHGMTANQLDALTKKAQSGNSLSQSVLQKIGIGNSLVQTAKNKAGAARNTEVDTLGGFTAGVKATTDALTGFRNVLNSFMETTHTGGIFGALEGGISSIPLVGGIVGKPLGLLSKVGGMFGVGGGSAPKMSSTAFSGSQRRGIGGASPTMSRAAYGATGDSRGLSVASTGSGIGGSITGLPTGVNVGGSGPNNMSGSSGGGSGAQQSSQQQDKGGGGGSGSSGISFIPPGPGVDSLDGETDFGPRNIGQGFHTGIDLMGGMLGASIKASADGTVTGAGWGASGDAGYGNTVMINHGSGYVTMYAHMSTISVSKGASVRQGQGIGAVGDTGSYSRGPHLHFELHINGTPVNPVPYITGKKGSYSSAPPKGSSSGASGQSQTSQGTGSAMGTTGAYSNGDRYGSTEEIDALAGILSGASTSSASTSTGSDSSTSGGGGGGNKGSGSTSSTGGSTLTSGKYQAGAGVQQWRGDVIAVMGQLGVKNPSSEVVNRVLMQMQTESGGDPTAINKWDSNWTAGHPSVGLMQVIQGTFDAYAGPYRHTGPFAYGVSEDPDANLYSALNYARARYGSWDNAFHGHGYAKGAWNLVQDELANVHKGEMIIPAKVAEAVRSELTAPSRGVTGSNGSGVTIQFGERSVVIQVSGAWSNEAAHDAGRQFLDVVREEAEKELMTSGAAYGQQHR